MPKLIPFPGGQQGPNGELVASFPDDFTPEDIESTFASMAPALEPQLEDPSIIANVGRGLVGGAVGIGQEFLTAGQALTGAEFFKAGQEKLGAIREDLGPIHVEPLEQLADIFDEEGLLSAVGEAVRPARLFPQVAEVVPQLAAMLIPGGIITKAGTKIAALSPKMITGARLLTTGTIGGIQEGGASFRETLEEGGTIGQARRNHFATTIVTGILNAAGAEALLTKFNIGAFGNLATRGGIEAFTEYLEEPAQILILESSGIDVDVRARLRAAFDVIPVAFAAGAGGSVVVDIVNKTAEGRQLTAEEQAILVKGEHTLDVRVPFQEEDFDRQIVPTLSNEEFDIFQGFAGRNLQTREQAFPGLVTRIDNIVTRLADEGVTNEEGILDGLLAPRSKGGLTVKDKNKIRAIALARTKAGRPVATEVETDVIIEPVRAVLRDAIHTVEDPILRQAVIESNNFIRATEGPTFTEMTETEINQSVTEGKFPLEADVVRDLGLAFDLDFEQNRLAVLLLADVVRHNALQAGENPNEFAKQKLAGFKKGKAPPIAQPELEQLAPELKQTPVRILVGEDLEGEFEIQFANDLDRAGFLVALDKPTEHHAELLEFLERTTGVSEEEAIQVGKVVQSQAQNQADLTEFTLPQFTLGSTFLPALLEARNTADKISIGTDSTKLPQGQIIGLDAKGDPANLLGNNASRFLFRGLTNPNLGTALHEIGHFSVLTATGKLKSVIESTFANGKKVEKWNIKDHEKFAETFETYFLTGQAPSTELSSAFSSIRDQMADIYPSAKAVAESVMTTEQKHTLNMLFTRNPAVPSARGITETQEVVEELVTFYQGKSHGDKLRKLDREVFEDAGFKRVTINKVIEAMERIKENPTITHNEVLEVGLSNLQDEKIVNKIIGKALRRIPLTNYEIFTIAAVRLEHIAEFNDMRVSKNPNAQAAFDERLLQIEQAQANARSMSGQNLNAHKVVRGIELVAKQLTKLKKLSPEQAIALSKLDMGRLDQVNDFLALLKGGRFFELKRAFLSLWYDSMLFNPGTFGINWMTNLANMFYTGGTRAHMALLDQFIHHITGKPRRVFLGEAYAHFGTVTRGITLDAGRLVTGDLTRAQKAAFDAMFGTRDEDGKLVFNTNEDSKWDDETGRNISRGFEDIFHKINFLQKPRINKIDRNAGELIALGLNGGTRSLRSMDVWSKALTYESEEKALRIKFEEIFKREGQAGVDREVNQLIEEEGRRLSRKSINATLNEKIALVSEGLVDTNGNPRVRVLTTQEKIEALIENRVKRMAEDTTFQSAPGNLTKASMRVRESMGIVGRMLVPFMQTPANITKRGTEFVPGFGIITAKWSGLPPAEIWAKQLEGAFVVFVVWSLLESGALTGDSPDDPAEKEAFFRRGKLPYALKAGDTYIQYRRFDPFSIPVGLLAGLYTEHKAIIKNNLDPSKKPMDAFDSFVAATNVASDLMIDSTYMQGVLGFLGTDRDLGRSLARTSSSFVPFSSMTRFLKRESEAFSTGQVRLLENDTFLSMFGQSLPIDMFRQSPENARLNVFGEEIVRDTNFLKEWIPLRMQPERTNTLEAEFLALDHYPGMPGRLITTHRKREAVRIPDDLYRDYVTASGNRIKEQLDGIVQRPFYISAPKEARIRMQQRVVDRIRRQESRKIKAQMRRLGL